MNWVKNKLLCRCRQTIDSDIQLDTEANPVNPLKDEFTKEEIKNICSWFHLNNYAEIKRLTAYHFKSRWEGVLTEGLSSKWIDFLMRDGLEEEFAADLMWERLHTLLISQWKAKPYQRSLITMTILQDSEEEAIPCKHLVQYVDEVMNSFFLILVFCENVEFKKWNQGSSTPQSNCMRSLRNYILKDLKNRNTVRIYEMEEWLESTEVLKDIMGEVCSLCVNLKPPPRQLIPTPLATSCWNPILNLGQLIFLSSLLQQDDTVEWRLLYNMEIHGGNLKKFEKLTKNKGPTALLIQDENDRVFGAYVTQPWTTEQHFYGNNQCFLFTLSPEMNVYRPSGASDLQYYYFGQDSKNPGVGLGSNIGNIVIWLEDGLIRGECSRDCCIFDRYEMPTLLPGFKLVQLQVWATRDRCECKKAQESIISLDNVVSQFN